MRSRLTKEPHGLLDVLRAVGFPKRTGLSGCVAPAAHFRGKVRPTEPLLGFEVKIPSVQETYGFFWPVMALTMPVKTSEGGQRIVIKEARLLCDAAYLLDTIEHSLRRSDISFSRNIFLATPEPTIAKLCAPRICEECPMEGLCETREMHVGEYHALVADAYHLMRRLRAPAPRADDLHEGDLCRSIGAWIANRWDIRSRARAYWFPHMTKDENDLTCLRHANP